MKESKSKCLLPLCTDLSFLTYYQSKHGGLKDSFYKQKQTETQMQHVQPTCIVRGFSIVYTYIYNQVGLYANTSFETHLILSIHIQQAI